MMTAQQAVVYGATATDKENDTNIKILQVDKTTTTMTASNDNPHHHHHIKHHIVLDNGDQQVDEATAIELSSVDEEQDTHQDTQSDKAMPIIKGSVSGKKKINGGTSPLHLDNSLTSIANTNTRILLPEEGEDSQQLLVSRGGKRLLKKKRIRAQIRNNNSWGRGGGRGGKGRKYGKGNKRAKSSKGGKGRKGWRNDDDDWFNEPKWDDNNWDDNKWNDDDWKNADWIAAPNWESSSWSSADWKKKEIVHVEPEHDICLQNPKGKSLFVSFCAHDMLKYTYL